MTDIDITGDLSSGDFDAGAAPTAHVPNAGGDAVQNAPAGAQHVSADVPKQPDQGKSEPSLRDTLSSAFKLNDPKPGDEQQQQQAAPTGETVALTQDAEGRFRRADGKFATSEEIEAFKATQVAQQPGTPEPQAHLTGMTPQELQQFEALPAELKQYVSAKMEALSTQAVQFQEYGLIEQIIGPRRDAWAQDGLTPATAVQQLFALSDFAGRSPGEFVMWFAKQQNLDLDALLDAADAGQANADPAFSALQNEVQQLRATVQQQQSGQQQADQQALVARVEQFATEKDNGGNLVRPYFAEVAQAIPAYVQALRLSQPNLSPDQILAQAYQSACWASPEVRAKMQAETDRQRQADATARAEQARAAGSSVTGAPAADATSVPNNANRTLRDELRAQFAAYH